MTMAEGAQMPGTTLHPGDTGAFAEASYRAIVDTACAAILVIREHGEVISFNPAAERLFGYREVEVIGRNVGLLIPGPQQDGPHRDAHDNALVRHRAADEQRSTGGSPQVEGLRKNGSVFPLALSVAEWSAGGQRYFTGIMRDLSEQLRAERLQQLLLAELNHRVKNTLAAVQAVVCQTLRNAPDVATARAALSGRLVALAKAHDILTRQSWDGADLADVIAETIAPHGGDARFSVGGDDARLTPKVALAMSMALHELCTNASKYGALSVETGHVAIETARTDSELRIVWRESRGPAVAAPDHRGFGSRMLAGLARDLEGEASFDFQPDGLVCTISAPLAVAEEAPAFA
jgi:PAS domain S-box-containing protein